MCEEGKAPGALEKALGQRSPISQMKTFILAKGRVIETYSCNYN